jgi:hypothetical protein
MQQHEIIGLGDYAENLMRQGHFNTLCDLFKKSAYDSMMATSPHEQKKRDGIYNEVWGLQSFLGLMQSFVQQRDNIIQSADDAEQSQSTADENHP